MRHRSISGQVLAALALMCASLAMSPWPAEAQTVYTVKPVAQKKVKELPPGPLYWRVENFPTLVEANAAVGPDGWNPASVSYQTTTSLIAEVDGRVWVLTLGPKGASTPGAVKVAEVGPVPVVPAAEYLLRVNEGSGPPGSQTPVHSHPGSEAFYVISGELGQRTAQGVMRVQAGNTMNGHEAGMAMQVFNSGTTDLTALIMFVVDASKPFSIPGKFE
jgi:mannose-6-phosphate isomerase-like protein (cupin superfamily)